jgi:hypothetical protein
VNITFPQQIVTFSSEANINQLLLNNYKRTDQNFKLFKKDSLKYQKQLDVYIISLYYDYFYKTHDNVSNDLKNLISENMESKIKWLNTRMNNNNVKLLILKDNDAHFKKSIDMEIKIKGLTNKLKNVQSQRTKYFEGEIKEINDRIDFLQMKINIINDLKKRNDIFSFNYIETYLNLFIDSKTYYKDILKVKKNICCCKK